MSSNDDGLSLNRASDSDATLINPTRRSMSIVGPLPFHSLLVRFWLPIGLGQDLDGEVPDLYDPDVVPEMDAVQTDIKVAVPMAFVVLHEAPWRASVKGCLTERVVCLNT